MIRLRIYISRNEEVSKKIDNKAWRRKKEKLKTLVEKNLKV